MTQPGGTADAASIGTGDAPPSGMTNGWRSFAIAHEAVCLCGHGMSLHRMLGGCVGCEERALAGLRHARCPAFAHTTSERSAAILAR